MTGVQSAQEQVRLAPRGRMLRAEIRNGVRSFVRNPVGAMFTWLAPLGFLIWVNVSQGDSPVPGLEASYAQATVPTVIVLSLVSACYLGLTPTIVIAREQAILKRIRTTPMSPLLYLVARAVVATMSAIGAIVVMVLVAVAFFDLRPSGAMIGGALALAVFGALTLCMLSFAASALCRNEQASLGVTFMTAIPLLVTSGMFAPGGTLPDWLRVIGDALPVRPLGQGLMSAFGATAEGVPAVPWQEIGVLGLWLVIATILALRFFRWEPRVN